MTSKERMMPTTDHAKSRPNVIFVLTDDQGYGDLSCHGNPILETPNLDRLHDESVRMTDFHVSPVCTPTRAALMTGRNPLRTGAWATSWGRALLRRDETTIAEVFRANGYVTAMFGKWHLGDTYPYRPTDRGFDHAVVHRGGGVGQTPDFWGNDYFDDTYWDDDRERPFDGYCTDIWFDLGARFLSDRGHSPFFLYLSTNAPHAPFHVPEHYESKYAETEGVPNAAYYGMIANIDENMGMLEQRLTELGLRENTILLFMTDNGVVSKGGFHDGLGFNAGMRGTKGSFYDGGHRVPCFFRWPGAGIGGGRDVEELSCHADILPTLADLCELDVPATLPWDGISLGPLLRGQRKELEARAINVLTRQGGKLPDKWGGTVMRGRRRLVGGTELYDISSDPGQQQDLSRDKPEVVSELREEAESFWESLGHNCFDYSALCLGGKENPVKLTTQDLRVQPGPDQERGSVAWDQRHVIEGAPSEGSWYVEVLRGGRYRFEVQRWPREAELSLAGLPEDHSQAMQLSASSALLRVGDRQMRQGVDGSAVAASFDVDLEAGLTELWAGFETHGGARLTAYYVYASYLGAS